MKFNLQPRKSNCICGKVCEGFYDKEDYENNEEFLFVRFICVDCLHNWDAFVINPYYKNPFYIDAVI